MRPTWCRPALRGAMMADESPIVLRQPRIEPPEGWSPFTPEGVLRIGPSDDGRLARLDAVVAFIMARDGLPCSAVVGAVCDAVDTQGDALPLYLLKETVCAVALPGNACFGGMGLYGQDIRPGTCGRAGAVGAMRRYWGANTRPECSVYEAVGLDCVAVTLRQACELWGYGQAVTPGLALTLPASFTPAPGWRLDDARGYMAFDGTDAGRLVLLRDLVQWRIQSKPCPPRVAVEDVIADLSATWATQWLYQVTPGDYAFPLRAGDCFSDVRGFWEQFAEDGTEKFRGLLGLLYAMREHWGADGLPDADQVQRKGLQALERVAIRMDVAHALWGWGTAAAPATLADTVPAAPPAVLVPDDVKDFETLVRYRQQFLHLEPQKRPKWLPKHIEIALDEVQLRGRGGKAAVAKELGYPTASGLNSVFAGAAERAERDAERAQASAFSKGLGQRRKAA